MVVENQYPTRSETPSVFGCGYAALCTAAAPVVWRLSHLGTGNYQSHRLALLREYVLHAVFGTTLGTIGIVALFTGVARWTLSFGDAFELWAGATAISIAGRMVLRVALGQIRRRGRNLRQVLILGSNRRAEEFVAAAGRHPELGLRVVGFADDPWVGAVALCEKGVEKVADLDSVESYLRESVVDEVVVCLPLKSYYEYVSRIASYCETLGILLRLEGELFSGRLAMASDVLSQRPLLQMGKGRIEGGAAVVKEVMDRSLALVLLLLTAPVMLGAAIAVRLSSPGPILFRQRRLGLNKRPFSMLKFRTMVADAEQRLAELEHRNEVKGAAFKLAGDPRITPVGRYLRKFSIDELPQLWNVLRGDMSLVGPRPLPLRDYNQFSEDWHRRRLSVRPGLSCLWQVSGRHHLSFDRWMELDMRYIDHWSLWLDIKILAKTLVVVLRGEGAW
ncbi:MAG: sugar transferase, partial [Bryobacteraceae bacterium]